MAGQKLPVPNPKRYPRERGIFTKQRPKGTKRFVWNGFPAKLSMRHIETEDGFVRLTYHERVDMTPAEQERYAPYIEKGLLTEVPQETPRRSPTARETHKGKEPEGEEPAEAPEAKEPKGKGKDKEPEPEPEDTSSED